ncbi:hypothetical protein HB662_01345 [Roseomonas frigidaquae]|uniref:Uncharacterized protein n=1 Tax=Falsiroseomonas frigidaquae TaxID=487318 RepID=A0ABX1EU15_9PROT|nr:hypothetical protein [Falsiroseomonas frigidaquae]NKE43404.1 hypothetical protein [Falsiroseomonas frigidaquae]
MTPVLSQAMQRTSMPAALLFQPVRSQRAQPWQHQSGASGSPGLFRNGQDTGVRSGRISTIPCAGCSISARVAGRSFRSFSIISSSLVGLGNPMVEAPGEDSQRPFRVRAIGLARNEYRRAEGGLLHAAILPARASTVTRNLSA